ncbi:DegV family protein [Lactobacillus sp. PSON]|uniref:DegV family protein n=1 Tax=Lactobacillus sp. PSON TaxID=3455454 RepID=UPI0040410CD6
MEKVRLILDSSSNEKTNVKNNLYVVPLTISFNGKEFRDDENLDLDAFLKDMQANNEAGKSSCPSIDDWLKALEGSEKAIILTLTSGMSGSYSSALQAKSMYEEQHPTSKVIVVDTRSAGPELAIILQGIEKLLNEKIRFVDLEQKIAELRMKTHLLFVLQSLHNLSLNGRVSPAVAKIAKMMNIKIVGTANKEGKLEPLAKARGMKKALKEVLKQMENMNYQGGEVIIDECKNEKDAQTLKEKILEKFPDANVKIRPTLGLCSFYAEEGGLMIGFHE